MAASEADPDATGASLTAVIEVSSSTVEEEKTVVSPFGSASTVSSVVGSCGGVVDQSCGQSAWSAVEVGDDAGGEGSGVWCRWRGRERCRRLARPEVAMSVQEEDPSAVVAIAKTPCR